jgi:hypothetical protein
VVQPIGLPVMSTSSRRRGKRKRGNG